jgi:hypothetical protein
VVPLWPGDEPPTSIFYAFLGSYVFIIGMITGTHSTSTNWPEQMVPACQLFLVSIQNQLTIIVFCNKKSYKFVVDFCPKNLKWYRSIILT